MASGRFSPNTMKISKLAKDTAKRIADNLSRGGHSLYMADLISMETAIQVVIDHVKTGGFTGDVEIATDGK